MTKDKKDAAEAAKLRNRAKGHLHAKTTQAHSPRTDVKSQKLHHELEVHRIELEMQNAQLRQARDDAETALEKYSDLYDFAPSGYFTLDRKGDIRAANLTGAALMGVARSRLIGRSFGLLVADAHRPPFTAFLGKAFATSAREACEVKLLQDGKSPLFVRIEAVAAASGTECRIALTDITERKLAEEELRGSEERLRQLIDGARDYAILMLDGHGRVSSWNEGARRLKGWDAEEILGRHFSLLYTAEAVAAGHPEHELEIAAATGRYEEEGWRVRKDGSRFMANVIITAIRDGSGKLCGFAKITRDITERKRAEESLRRAKEGAEVANRAKSQFLANMSHELRTPMTGVLGMLQLALEEELAPTPRDYLETTLTSARSLLRIINDILIMTEIEGGKLTIAKEPFSLQRCMTEAVDLFTPEARRKGLDFALMIAEEAPEKVVGDEARLRQVLLNLVGNAVKFTEKGKVGVRVAANGATADGKREFTFAVEDTGIGIPQDKLNLLFRPFSQLDDSHTRQYGGTGLGLAISRELVEKMGGTISFESEEGMGSTFSCTIPMGEAGLDGDLLSATDSLPRELTLPHLEGKRKTRLLHAEDDHVIRLTLGLMLQHANCDIEFAEDGLKAVEMWEKGEFDLVLMDIQMPRLNGFEATRAIREKERVRGGHTPIVAVTAHARKEDVERCLDAGMDAFIPKPIDFKKCIEVIRGLIEKNG